MLIIRAASVSSLCCLWNYKRNLSICQKSFLYFSSSFLLKSSSCSFSNKNLWNKWNKCSNRNIIGAWNRLSNFNLLTFPETAPRCWPHVVMFPLFGKEKATIKTTCESKNFIFLDQYTKAACNAHTVAIWSHRARYEIKLNT